MEGRGRLKGMPTHLVICGQCSKPTPGLGPQITLQLPPETSLQTAPSSQRGHHPVMGQIGALPQAGSWQAPTCQDLTSANGPCPGGGLSLAKGAGGILVLRSLARASAMSFQEH